MNQFLFQRWQRAFTKGLVYFPVLFQALIADRFHIFFFISKMLDRVALKELDALLTHPVAVLLFRPHNEQLVDDLEEPLVFFVN